MVGFGAGSGYYDGRDVWHRALPVRYGYGPLRVGLPGLAGGGRTFQLTSSGSVGPGYRGRERRLNWVNGLALTDRRFPTFGQYGPAWSANSDIVKQIGVRGTGTLGRRLASTVGSAVFPALHSRRGIGPEVLPVMERIGRTGRCG